MGTYLIIPKNENRTKKLKVWFEKWKPFYNDFGDEHSFADLFGDLQYEGGIRFKIEGGCPLREIHSKESVEEIKNLIIEFGGNPKEQ